MKVTIEATPAQNRMRVSSPPGRASSNTTADTNPIAARANVKQPAIRNLRSDGAAGMRVRRAPFELSGREGSDGIRREADAPRGMPRTRRGRIEEPLSVRPTRAPRRPRRSKPLREAQDGDS